MMYPFEICAVPTNAVNSTPHEQIIGTLNKKAIGLVHAHNTIHPATIDQMLKCIQCETRDSLCSSASGERT